MKELGVLCFADFPTIDEMRDRIIAEYVMHPEAKSSIRNDKEIIKQALCGNIDKLNSCIQTLVNNDYIALYNRDKHYENFYQLMIYSPLKRAKWKGLDMAREKWTPRGRFDIHINNLDSGAIFELKVKKDKESIDKCHKKARDQIHTKNYISSLKKKGIEDENIYCYSVVFLKNNVSVKMVDKESFKIIS